MSLFLSMIGALAVEYRLPLLPLLASWWVCSSSFAFPFLYSSVDYEVKPRLPLLTVVDTEVAPGTLTEAPRNGANGIKQIKLIVNMWTLTLLTQSTHQPASQAFNQTTNQPVNQPTIQLANQSISELENSQPVSH